MTRVTFYPRHQGDEGYCNIFTTRDDSDSTIEAEIGRCWEIKGEDSV